MKQQNYNVITALLFVLVAIIHIVRIEQGWTISINNYVLPIWVSWAGLVITGLLALWGYKLLPNKHSNNKPISSSVHNHNTAPHMR